MRGAATVTRARRSTPSPGVTIRDQESALRSFPSATTASLLDVPAAAQRLGVPVRFVRQLVAERRVRFVKLGRYVRFDPADLDVLVAAGVVAPVRQPEHRGGHRRS